jgi:uncharacterized protein
VKVLAISDKIIDFIYSPTVRERFGHVDLVIGCGDLPYYYMEYIVSMLDKPLYFVRGNHASRVEYSAAGPRRSPWGAIDLHKRVEEHEGLLMAGLQGSIRYNKGPFQYTEQEMQWNVAQMLPQLFMNRARHGRFLDVLVAHSPPRGVNDQDDRCHTGFKVFRWLLQYLRPRWMLHGHIHLYHPDTSTRSIFHDTEVINCYGYKELELYPVNGPERVSRGQDTHGESISDSRL